MKEFWRMLGMALWAIIMIASGAAAISTLEGFYVFCGIANILINSYCIYKTTKKIREDAGLE